MASETSAASAAALLDLQLEMREVHAQAEWASDLAEARIKVFCGANEKVTGVCTWKREEKKTDVTDWAAITNEHPDKCRECLTFKEGRTAVVLAEGQARADE